MSIRNRLDKLEQQMGTNDDRQPILFTVMGLGAELPDWAQPAIDPYISKQAGVLTFLEWRDDAEGRIYAQIHGGGGAPNRWFHVTPDGAVPIEEPGATTRFRGPQGFGDE